jgi:hypothetical protein
MRKYYLTTLLSIVSIMIFAQNPYAVKAKTNEVIKTEISKEEKFIIETFPFKHITDWENGMRFMVEPADKSSVISEKLKLVPLGKSGKISYSDEPELKDYEWKIFTYNKIEERDFPCSKGNCVKTYVILDCEGEKFEYEYFGSIEDLKSSDSFTTISHLVYLGDIDKAKELLVNKVLYITDEIWYKESEDNNIGEMVVKNKYIPITITNIGIGNNNAIKVVFKGQNGDEYFLNVSFSGTNIGGMDKVFSKKFQDVFMFDNPKVKYPQISNEFWQLIQKGIVRAGMTETECELSWGKPDDINTTTGSFGIHKQWVYEGQGYLYFENGILKTIQN